MGRADPIEVAAGGSIEVRVNVGTLLGEADASAGAGDGLRQILGWREAERLIDVGEMLAIQLVEVSVVGGGMFRPIPPVPVAAFGDEQFLERQLALLLAEAGLMFGVGFARG